MSFEWYNNNSELKLMKRNGSVTRELSSSCAAHVHHQIAIICSLYNVIKLSWNLAEFSYLCNQMVKAL
jgi:hypothetical protein